MTPFAAPLLALTLLAADGRGARRFAEARRAQAALEYDRALTLAQEALEQGDCDVELTRRLFTFQAEMALAVGLTDTAVSAYARALELNPGLELPLDASPRLARPFRQAKDRLGGARLTAIPDSTRTGEGLVRTRVRLDGDLLHLVFGARVHPEGGAPVVLARTDAFEGHWACARTPCAHHVVLLDGPGNELLHVGSPASPLLVPDPPVVRRATDPRPWYRRGWPYVVAGGVLAAAGGVFAVRTAQVDTEFLAARDAPGQHTLAEVQALDATRQQSYGVAAASFVLAGASIALGIGWWSWD